MNEIFEFRKELNTKKIILVAVLILVIILGTIFLFSHFSRKREEKIEAEKPTKTFYDENKTISLEFAKTYSFSQYKASNNYLMELRTDNNLNIFVSKNDLIENRNLIDIASNDINTYISEFKSSSNISEISEFEFNNKTAYTYSLHYLNSKTPFYLQVIWIEAENCYYTLDVEFPLDNLSDYSNIINDIINSFVIY